MTVIQPEATRGTILVVDDDPALRETIGALVCELGYVPRSVGTAAQAMAELHSADIALVVIDLLLPDVSGYELIRRIRDTCGEMLPIVLVSGIRTEPIDQAAGLLVGADEYLVKPFSSDEFLARVRRLLTRAAGVAVTSIQPNEAGEAAGSERVRDLTARELMVLSLLTEGFDQTDITKRLGISHRTVGVHIEHILAKLGVHTRTQAVALAFRESLVATDRLRAGDGVEATRPLP